MKVSWTPPDLDGGSPIFRYLLEYKEKTSTGWISINVNKPTDTSVVVKSLNENTEYEFRVYAENEVGLSNPSPVAEGTRTLGMSLKCSRHFYKIFGMHFSVRLITIWVIDSYIHSYKSIYFVIKES